MAYTELEKAHLIATAAKGSRKHIFSHSKFELIFTLPSCPLKFLVSRILDVRRLIEGSLGVTCKITGGGYACIEFSIGVDDPRFNRDDLNKILMREDISNYLQNCGIQMISLGERGGAGKKVIFYNGSTT